MGGVGLHMALEALAELLSSVLHEVLNRDCLLGPPRGTRELSEGFSPAPNLSDSPTAVLSLCHLTELGGWRGFSSSSQF